MLAISDTEITPLDLQKMQSGDPFDFQRLYRKYHDLYVNETKLLLTNQKDSMAVVQLSCIRSWIQCEAITSEKYYCGYARNRMLRYAQVWSQTESRIQQELEILKEILSDQYALTGQQLSTLYGHFTPAQKELIRQVFKSYFQASPVPISIEYAPLLRYAFYALHYILV